MNENPQADTAPLKAIDSAKTLFQKWMRNETALLFVLLALAVLTWLPRLEGPIDLRWDGGVYYILGTSLAEGKGYKLLNEPGEIDAVQYPPLLPLIIAGHQLILKTNDPTTVGHWLRFSAFIIFLVYIYVAFKFFRNYLSLHWSFLATVLCLFSLYVYYLSDWCYPEILFSLITILFVLCCKKYEANAYSMWAYLLAVISYTLRTVGLVAFAAWIFESLIRKQFKQAALRTVLVLIPVLCWQFYIASIESSYEYNHPVYAYQRAPYMFYNVTYARNFSLEEPFTPENGQAKILMRFIQNAVKVPIDIGESVSTMRGFWIMCLQSFLGYAESTKFIISWLVLIIVYVIGLFVLGGLFLQVLRRQWIITLYVIPYLGTMCFTPFPDQYTRYLMPVVPFLVLSLIFFLIFVKDKATIFLPSNWSKFGAYLTVSTLLSAFLMQLFCFQSVYKNDFEKTSYLDINDQLVEQRLFYYNENHIDFDSCITYIHQNAKPDDIVAAGMPHRVYLRTGLKAVMTPFESDVVKEQLLLDSVPVRYLIIGSDPIKSMRYTMPVVEQFSNQWRQVYTTPDTQFAVYERVSQ